MYPQHEIDERFRHIVAPLTIPTEPFELVVTMLVMPGRGMNSNEAMLSSRLEAREWLVKTMGVQVGRDWLYVKARWRREGARRHTVELLTPRKWNRGKRWPLLLAELERER